MRYGGELFVSCSAFFSLVLRILLSKCRICSAIGTHVSVWLKAAKILFGCCPSFCDVLSSESCCLRTCLCILWSFWCILTLLGLRWDVFLLAPRALLFSMARIHSTCFMPRIKTCFVLFVFLQETDADTCEKLVINPEHCIYVGCSCVMLPVSLVLGLNSIFNRVKWFY